MKRVGRTGEGSGGHRGRNLSPTQRQMNKTLGLCGRKGRQAFEEQQKLDVKEGGGEGGLISVTVEPKVTEGVRHLPLRLVTISPVCCQ